MKTKLLYLTFSLCLLVPAMASASGIKYSYAQIYQSNSTVDLVPSTSGNGTLSGIKCIFPSTDGGAAVKVTVTLDGNASSFTVDPTDFERESDGAGQYLSGWIPMANVYFSTSIHIALNNTNLGTATINCWASWFFS